MTAKSKRNENRIDSINTNSCNLQYVYIPAYAVVAVFNIHAAIDIYNKERNKVREKQILMKLTFSFGKGDE